MTAGSNAMTLGEFRTANHIGRGPSRSLPWGMGQLDCPEPTYAELCGAAAGIWAFVLEIEADDRVIRRMLGIGGRGER